MSRQPQTTSATDENSDRPDRQRITSSRERMGGMYYTFRLPNGPSASGTLGVVNVTADDMERLLRATIDAFADYDTIDDYVAWLRGESE